MTQNRQDQAADVVDASGLLSGLLEQQASQRSDFELLLDKPIRPEPTMRQKIVRRAIEAVQSGEFGVMHSYYISNINPDFPSLHFYSESKACGCAIAALYYAGVQLEVAEQKEYASKVDIYAGLSQHISQKLLINLERHYECLNHTPERMIYCLSQLLE